MHRPLYSPSRLGWAILRSAGSLRLELGEGRRPGSGWVKAFAFSIPCKLGALSASFLMLSALTRLGQNKPQSPLGDRTRHVCNQDETLNCSALLPCLAPNR